MGIDLSSLPPVVGLYAVVIIVLGGIITNVSNKLVDAAVAKYKTGKAENGGKDDMAQKLNDVWLWQKVDGANLLVAFNRLSDYLDKQGDIQQKSCLVLERVYDITSHNGKGIEELRKEVRDAKRSP